jgi:LacI family transcriptional regulator
MTKAALSSTPKPTALFAANNFVAVGAIQSLREQNLRVPEDIALVTIDDIPLGLNINPFLTVANQPAREMGKQAARLLLERIKGETDHPCQQITLPTEMIIRASSGESILP